MPREILCAFSVHCDAVAGWLGSCGGEDSPGDISRGVFAAEVGSLMLGCQPVFKLAGNSQRLGKTGKSMSQTRQAFPHARVEPATGALRRAFFAELDRLYALEPEARRKAG